MKQVLVRFQDRLPDMLALTAVGTFILIAAYRIHLPGLYYDEVLFVNAARGDPGDDFIFARFCGLPVMLMPYIGALKAWLYAPIFATFGISPCTIRLPVIFISGITILVYYLLLRKTLGHRWACAVAWLMALNPAFLFTSRLDWGPVVLMQFFKALMLLLWFAYLEKPSFWKLLSIGACALLGFFDKFNFIWLILAFGFGAVLVYRQEVRSAWYSLSPRLRLSSVIVSLMAAIAMTLLIIPMMQFPAPAEFAKRISDSWNGLLDTLSGTAVANFIFGSSEGIFRFEPWATIFPAMLGGVVCLLPRSGSPAFLAQRKAGWFCIAAMFLLFVQIVLTPQAGGPHHYVMAFPLPLLALAFCWRAIVQHLADSRNRLTARVFAAITAVAFLVLAYANAADTLVYLKHFKTSAAYNPRWSPSVYNLVKFINKKGPDVEKIVCIDWGIANQLEALCPTDIEQKLYDFWTLFRDLPESTNPNSSDDLVHVFDARRNLAICFAESKETFPETRRHFLAHIQSRIFHSRLLTTIDAPDHTEIYEIYEITDHSEAGQR